MVNHRGAKFASLESHYTIYSHGLESSSWSILQGGKSNAAWSTWVGPNGRSDPMRVEAIRKQLKVAEILIEDAR